MRCCPSSAGTREAPPGGVTALDEKDRVEFEDLLEFDFGLTLHVGDRLIFGPIEPVQNPKIYLWPSTSVQRPGPNVDLNQFAVSHEFDDKKGIYSCFPDILLFTLFNLKFKKQKQKECTLSF